MRVYNYDISQRLYLAVLVIVIVLVLVIDS
jgi:hypothetical protein